MPAQRLRLPEETAALVRSLHPDIKRKIKAALQMILASPHAGKALKDELSGYRSFRVGNFRVVYRINEEIIEVAAVGPRKTIYEETFRLVRKTQKSVRPS